MVRKDCKDGVGAGVEIVVVDFGLAEYVGVDGFLYSRCGTPGYVAPEILGRKRNVEEEKYN